MPTQQQQRTLDVFKFHPNADWEALEEAISHDPKLAEEQGRTTLGSDSRAILKQIITKSRKHIYYWRPEHRQQLIAHLEAHGFSHTRDIPSNFRRYTIRPVPKKKNDLKRLKKILEDMDDPTSFMPKNDVVYVNISQGSEVQSALEKCGFEAYKYS